MKWSLTAVNLVHELLRQNGLGDEDDVDLVCRAKVVLGLDNTVWTHKVRVQKREEIGAG